MKRLADNPELVSGEFAALSLTEKELVKHAVIERVPFDLTTYIGQGTIAKNADTLLITLYAIERGSTGKPVPKTYMLKLEREVAEVG